MILEAPPTPLYRYSDDDGQTTGASTVMATSDTTPGAVPSPLPVPDPGAAQLAREILAVLIDGHPSTRAQAVNVLSVVPGLCDLAAIGAHWSHAECDPPPPAPTWWWSTLMPAVWSNAVYGWHDREVITVAGLVVDQARADLADAAPLDDAQGEGRSNLGSRSSHNRRQSERVCPRNSQNAWEDA